MWIWIRRPNFSLKCTKSYNCKNNFSRREWCSLFWHYFLLNFLLIFFVLAFCYFLFAFYKIHFAWVFLCKVFPHSGKNCIFVHIFYSFFNFKFYPSLQKSINMLVIRKRLFRFYFEKITYVNNIQNLFLYDEIYLDFQSHSQFHYINLLWKKIRPSHKLQY